MVEMEAATLDERQAKICEAFLRFRECGSETEAQKARERSKLEGQLDEIYWQRVETLVAERIQPERDELAFSDEERLLIDMGLLDLTLVENAPPDLPQRLLEEMETPGPINHFYLSEWLEDRYRRYRLTVEMDAAVKRRAASHADIRASRARILEKLSPLFAGLPGVNREIAQLMISGALDEQLIRLSIALLREAPRRRLLHRRRLAVLRQQILEKARSRAADAAQQKLFDMLDELYSRDWRQQYAKYQKGDKGAGDTAEAARGADEVERERAAAYLRSELRFVRTLFPLGALAGGVSRTCAVLLQDGRRVTKADTAQSLLLAQTCDRGFAINPVVLIAPFRGRGIFEWDRDSLVIGLVPVGEAAESVANAVANFRMLRDSFQDQGAMRKAYENAFGAGAFQRSFPSDYRLWVTRVGRGDAQALPPQRFRFMREWIGPDCSGVLAPPNLRHLSPQAREAIRRRIEKQSSMADPDAQMHRRLAVLCWQDGDLENALRHMALAAKATPQDGEILFSLGLILRQQGQMEKARGVFQSCAQRAAGTLWSVYAAAAAQGEM